jgi:hypothetical protein
VTWVPTKPIRAGQRPVWTQRRVRCAELLLRLGSSEGQVVPHHQLDAWLEVSIETSEPGRGSTDRLHKPKRWIRGPDHRSISHPGHLRFRAHLDVASNVDSPLPPLHRRLSSDRHLFFLSLLLRFRPCRKSLQVSVMYSRNPLTASAGRLASPGAR